MHEVRREVAGAGFGLASALGERADPVLANPVERGDHRLDAVGVAAKAVEEVLHPRHEQIGVGRRTADHGEEHLRRVSQREPGNEVAPTSRHDLLDQATADLTSHRFGSVDGPWREPGIEDLAVRDVVRRVDLCRHEPVDGIRVPRRDRLAGEDVRIAVHVPDPLVVGEHPVPLRHRVEQRRTHRPVLVGETPVTPCLERRREVGMHRPGTSPHPSPSHRSVRFRCPRRVPSRRWICLLAFATRRS